MYNSVQPCKSHSINKQIVDASMRWKVGKLFSCHMTLSCHGTRLMKQPVGTLGARARAYDCTVTKKLFFLPTKVYSKSLWKISVTVIKKPINLTNLLVFWCRLNQEVAKKLLCNGAVTKDQTFQPHDFRTLFSRNRP